jgi:hypothetical protein
MLAFKVVSVLALLSFGGFSTFLFTMCQSNSALETNNTVGNTIGTRFKTPKGYTRTFSDSLAFGSYLRNVELQAIGSEVHLFNGEVKSNKIHAGILKFDVGTKDLQQCADACMRLRAEYLYSQKRYTEIQFSFTNGFVANYGEWRKGKRILVNGNNVNWSTAGKADTSHTSFRLYLDKVYTYAGTLSLQNSLKATSFTKLQIGDLIVQGGSPGHAVTIVDMAQNEEGKTIVLIAQSYMPAQEIHVVQNLSDASLSPWIVIEENTQVDTPEWGFKANSWKKW